MGGFRSDYPLVTITLERWQKNWIKQQHAMNFSGLVQEMISEIIRQRDPAYYEMNATITTYNIQRKDTIKELVKNHPEIIPVNTGI